MSEADTITRMATLKIVEKQETFTSATDVAEAPKQDTPSSGNALVNKIAAGLRKRIMAMVNKDPNVDLKQSVQEIKREAMYDYQVQKQRESRLA